jgi:hypothetical protein
MLTPTGVSNHGFRVKKRLEVSASNTILGNVSEAGCGGHPCHTVSFIIIILHFEKMTTTFHGNWTIFSHTQQYAKEREYYTNNKRDSTTGVPELLNEIMFVATSTTERAI